MTETERNDIICALEIAIEQYERDEITWANQPRIAAQFREQIERAEALIERMS